MTAEEFIIQYLANTLTVPVSGDVPSPKPERFVTVEQVASKTENHVYHPRLAVQSWAESRNDASDLNEEVKKAMAAAVAAPEISRCALDTDYNFPELELKHPRYQAMFEITYLG
jgi:hypothetical protein